MTLSVLTTIHGFWSRGDSMLGVCNSLDGESGYHLDILVLVHLKKLHGVARRLCGIEDGKSIATKITVSTLRHFNAADIIDVLASLSINPALHFLNRCLRWESRDVDLALFRREVPGVIRRLFNNMVSGLECLI